MLSRRLILFIALPLVVSLIIGGAMMEQFLAKGFERRMQAEVEMVARALKIPVGYAVKTGRNGDITRALESTELIGRVYSADVFDENGQLVASTRAADRDLDVERVARLSSTSDQEGGYRQVDGREVYSHFVTLTGADGRPSGFLEVTRLKSDFQKFISEFRRKAVTYFVVMLGVVLLIVSVGYYAAMGRALSSLHRTILKVRDGAHAERAPASGPQEVALLASSFNDMLDAIASAEDQIERQREHQSELERRLRRAERLAALGRLAGGVAHELGTPLSTVTGRATRALRTSDLSERVRHNLDVVVREARRMERIVRELLDFGRTAHGRRREVDVETLIRSACSAVADHLERNSTSLRVCADESVRLTVNPARFERALTNLLQNASDAVGDGEIRVAWRMRGDDELAISIEDDGPGIPRSRRQQVFEPFYTTRSGDGGTGLGLSIVHAIVAEHGGTVAATDPRQLGGIRMCICVPTDAGKENCASSEAASPSSLIQWF